MRGTALAKSLSTWGTGDKAIEYYRKALQIDPEFASAKEQLRKFLEE